ncbi:unnamed protein product [Camellia sinensis]
MGCSVVFIKKLLGFLVFLAIVFSLLGGSQARLISSCGVDCEDFKNDRSMVKKMFMEFEAMLPKGVPVPPSGPSPGINL